MEARARILPQIKFYIIQQIQRLQIVFPKRLQAGLVAQAVYTRTATLQMLGSTATIERTPVFTRKQLWIIIEIILRCMKEW